MKVEGHKVDNRIRLSIIGGFLGAGKSTWLRHQLFADVYDNPNIIVNELSKHAVDDILLHTASNLHVLKGGCACCNKKPQMLALLHKICNNNTFIATNVRHLVFEMSGVANPANVITAIQNDTILARHILLSEIVVIVDGINGLEQLESEQLARQQIETADRILINKVDQSKLEYLSELFETIKVLNPNANIIFVSFGEKIVTPNLPKVSPKKLSYLSKTTEKPLESIQLKIADDTASDEQWANLTVWLSAMLHKHGANIVRIKGVVRTPAGRLLLQSVRKLMQVPEILPNKSSQSDFITLNDNKIVLIGRGLDKNKIEESLISFLSLGQ